MKYLLLPLKVIGFLLLFVLSLALRLLGLFVIFISSVLGVFTMIIGTVVDLGAIIMTVCWLMGMESATGDVVLFMWVFAACWSCAWLLGRTFGEWLSEKGEDLGDFAFSLFSSNKHEEAYETAEYYSDNNRYQNQESGETEEIYKFKQLLDVGAITQEEFDAKKKQILGV